MEPGELHVNIGRCGSLATQDAYNHLEYSQLTEDPDVGVKTKTDHMLQRLWDGV